MEFEIRTERLRLRHLKPSDAEFILGLVNEPGWIRFIGDRQIHTVVDAEGYIERCAEAVRKMGYGMDLLEISESATPVGVCGLVKRDGLPGPDLGFAVAAHHEGLGYATEAGRATLEHAQRLGLPKVLAVCRDDNLGSVAVLSKLGFAFVGPWLPPGEDDALRLYQWQAPGG